MQLRRESFEVVSSAKSGVELGRISYPIAVVRVAVSRAGPLIVLIYGTNPNCSDINDCGSTCINAS